MHFTPEQREAWNAETRDSPFNRWLRARTTGRDGLLDLGLLAAVAAEFGVDAAKYAHLNAGQQRMNVGNRLRRLVPETAYSIRPAPGEDASPSPTATAVAHRSAPLDAEWPFLQTATATTLLRLQAAAVEELRRRHVVRTGNAPLGDYAEHLFAKAFGWELTVNSATGYDAKDNQGTRYQIKARRLRNNVAGERQLGVLRGLPDKAFDYLAAALFDCDFAVSRAAIIPHAAVASRAMHIKHVNGWRFLFEDAVWLIEGVRDVTEAVQSAAASLNSSEELRAQVWAS
ncbi:hypothetical protein [Sphingomonas baiyangensis]|uniref:Uncharacterized protein n=1 Tax=Sphingomonas baiyangensis TaxID=2572576 RepID=A0A4U1L5N2_9SPHN|nr:hypothetical protein [Sphingomonas baiyangensis]TKD51535.1 hypothetical protein FBR43_12800 [Sphingomonas baiyangensis]